MFTTLLISAVLVAAPAAPAAQTSPAPAAKIITTHAISGLAVIPAAIDLGTVTPGSTISGSAWLVNTSYDPITIDKTKAGCGCTTIRDAEVTIAPGAAHRISFDIDAPKKATNKAIKMTFQPSWGEPVAMTASLATSDDAVHSSTDLGASEHRVSVVPVKSDLGSVTSGVPIDTAAWLINTSDTFAYVREFKTGCGCTTAIGFEPVRLEPGMAQQVRLRITPGKPTATSSKKVVKLKAVVEGEPTAAQGVVSMRIAHD